MGVERFNRFLSLFLSIYLSIYIYVLSFHLKHHRHDACQPWHNMQASSPASPVDTKQRRWVETCLVLAQNRCCLMVSSLMLGDVWNQITDQTWSWDYEFPLQWWRESYFCTLLGTPLKAYCMHLGRHWESDEEKVRAVSFRDFLPWDLDEITMGKDGWFPSI